MEVAASLYRQLGCQLRTLWSNGQQALDGAQEPKRDSSEPEPTQIPAVRRSTTAVNTGPSTSGIAGERTSDTANRRQW